MKLHAGAIAAIFGSVLTTMPVYAEVDYVKCEAMDSTRQKLFQGSALQLVRAQANYEAVIETPGGEDSSMAKIRIFYKKLAELQQGKGDSDAVAVMKKITTINNQMTKNGCPGV